jgi:four helix bundle protein
VTRLDGNPGTGPLSVVQDYTEASKGRSAKRIANDEDNTDVASNAQRGKSKVASDRNPRRPHWRFQDLEIWNVAVELAVQFHQIADRLDKRRFYRYAEQIRAAGLSLSNNIAEGSGSTHKQEFIQFLNIARRSLFEDASMLLVFERLALLRPSDVDELLWNCDEASRKITNFARSL